MKIKINNKTNFIIVFLLSAVLFFAFTMPYRVWFSVADITDMRPTTALTPVLGMIFGLAASLGCAAGNFISDLISGYEMSYAVLSALQQIVYGMLPYFLWKKLNKERGGDEFRLDSISRMLKFCFVMLVDAALIVVCAGIVNHAYSVTDFVSINNLYLFLNSFDSGLLFGCPLLIGGHLFRRYMENLKSGNKEKVIFFSLNERMIINTIIMGIGISLLIGSAVYLTDRMNESGSAISLGGRIYLFQTLALNFYFALSIGFMWFTEKRIAKPVENLAEIAAGYYLEHFTDEQRSHMIDECEKYAADSTEVGNLARSYISMVNDIKEYVSNLQSITAEKERINAELNLASNIQAHMLPCIFPAFPEHDECDIYATMTPAKEVGGDFYDFFMIDRSHLAVVMADVSGKGVPAALFMVIAKTLIKNYAQMGNPVNEVFNIVNRLLCDGNDAGLFVTAWMGLLELETGRFTYVNAGHNPPLFARNNGEFEYIKARPGFVLAGVDTVKYKLNEMMMMPGDRIFLYTDGVTEATDADNQLYGVERLIKFMNSHRTDSATDMLHELKADIDSFVGEAPQFDDVTMLMLDFKKVLNETDMLEKTFPAEISALGEVIKFAETELEKVECPMKITTQLLVAVEEVFVNIAHYAYPDSSGEAVIGFCFDDKENAVTFRICDRGIPFDPLAKPDPDITLPAQERQIGGLGIFICKKTMDDISYKRENGQNILTLFKKI